MRSFLLLSFVALAAVACNESVGDTAAFQMVPSTGIATAELEATFSVSGDIDDASLVRASVFFSRKQAAEGVYLSGDDAAFVDGQRITSDRTFDNGSLVLPRKPAGERYRFEIRRPNETITADVVAAEPVEVLAPAAETEVTFGSKLAVSWRAAADSSIQAQVSGRCLMATQLLDRESGSVVIDVDRVPEAPPSSGPSTPGYDPSGATGCAGAGSVVLMRKREEQPTTAFARTSTIAYETSQVKIQLKTE